MNPKIFLFHPKTIPKGGVHTYKDPGPVWFLGRKVAHVHRATTENYSAFSPRPNSGCGRRRTAIFVRVSDVVSHHTDLNQEFDSKGKNSMHFFALSGFVIGMLERAKIEESL